MNLITSFYETSNQHRNNEILDCLSRNIKNKFIEKIYLLNEQDYPILSKIENASGKIVAINLGKRLTFADAISFVNSNLVGKICIIANSDIYYDHTLTRLLTYNFKNKIMALSRNDMKRKDSQDSWIGVAPLNINLVKSDFAFGVLGCDNVFAKVCRDSGYIVINPCKTIKSYHLHFSNFRTYSKKNRVAGGFYFVEPSFLI